MTNDPIHERLLKIVLKLPGAYEDRPWGSVHCKVAGKIFVGWGRHEDGEMEMGFRVDMDLQSLLVASDPRFRIAKYSGPYGGVDMLIGPKPNWAEIEQFIVGSYRKVAPKKLVKELDAQGGAAATAPAKEPPASKKASAPKKAAAPKKAPSPKKAAAPKKTAAPKKASPSKKASTPKKASAPKKTATKKASS